MQQQDNIHRILIRTLKTITKKFLQINFKEIIKTKENIIILVYTVQKTIALGNAKM